MCYVVTKTKTVKDGTAIVFFRGDQEPKEYWL